LTLNIEKDKLQSELSKIPEHAKTGALLRRRETLEQETDILKRQIGTLKQKLRDLQVL